MFFPNKFQIVLQIGCVDAALFTYIIFALKLYIKEASTQTIFLTIWIFIWAKYCPFMKINIWAKYFLKLFAS